MKNELSNIVIADENAMLQFGAKLAEYCGDTAVIFLYGDLGAGKTTLARGFLRGLGYTDKVKSPTYTIVEPYAVQHKKIFHFDLYRVSDPRELEFIGIQDYFIPQAICLVEWPEHGKEVLPVADLSCHIDTQMTGREIKLTANTERGRKILAQLA